MKSLCAVQLYHYVKSMANIPVNVPLESGSSHALSRQLLHVKYTKSTSGSAYASEVDYFLPSVRCDKGEAWKISGAYSPQIVCSRVKTEGCCMLIQ